MSECDFCGGLGQIPYEDPATRRPATMLCPQCTPASVDLDPQVEDEFDDDYSGDLAYEGSW
jgi:hypothetical protein